MKTKQNQTPKSIGAWILSWYLYRLNKYRVEDANKTKTQIQLGPTFCFYIFSKIRLKQSKANQNTK